MAKTIAKNGVTLSGEALPTNGAEIVEANEQQGGTDIMPLAQRMRGFLKPERTGFKMPIEPRDWRCNAKDGFFSCDNEILGGTITFRVVDWRIEQNVYFSTVYKEPEDVIQAIIIDQWQVVGTIVFRTISMHEFMLLMDKLDDKRIPFSTVDITATLVMTTTKKKYQFYISKFSYADGSEEYTNGIISFIKECPQVLECWRQLPKVDPQTGELIKQ